MHVSFIAESFVSRVVILVRIITLETKLPAVLHSDIHF
jgi:hypothetical protein